MSRLVIRTSVTQIIPATAKIVTIRVVAATAVSLVLGKARQADTPIAIKAINPAIAEAGLWSGSHDPAKQPDRSPRAEQDENEGETGAQLALRLQEDTEEPGEGDKERRAHRDGEDLPDIMHRHVSLPCSAIGPPLADLRLRPNHAQKGAGDRGQTIQRSRQTGPPSGRILTVIGERQEDVLEIGFLGA